MVNVYLWLISRYCGSEEIAEETYRLDLRMRFFNPRHGSLVTIDIASTVSPETDSIAWRPGEHQVMAIAGNSWYFLMILRNLPCFFCFDLLVLLPDGIL